MSCCGCCGGEDAEKNNEQDKNENKDKNINNEPEQEPTQVVKQEKAE